MTATPFVPRRSALTPIGVDAVRLDEGFWGRRQGVNRGATIPHAAAWMERLDWLRLLETARSDTRIERRGREFTDSETYKLIEAISWGLARDGASPHAGLLERLVGLVVGAQEPDGYVHTLYGRHWQKPRYSEVLRLRVGGSRPRVRRGIRLRLGREEGGEAGPIDVDHPLSLGLAIGPLGASPGQVYRWCMARTNIDLDDALVGEVMRRFGLPSKRAAVDFALRRLVGPTLTRAEMLEMEGSGWDGDLDALRREVVEPV